MYMRISLLTKHCHVQSFVRKRLPVTPTAISYIVSFPRLPASCNTHLLLECHQLQ
jgi:hypothetical protein